MFQIKGIPFITEQAVSVLAFFKTAQHFGKSGEQSDISSHLSRLSVWSWWKHSTKRQNSVLASAPMLCSKNCRCQQVYIVFDISVRTISVRKDTPWTTFYWNVDYPTKINISFTLPIRILCICITVIQKMYLHIASHPDNTFLANILASVA